MRPVRNTHIKNSQPCFIHDQALCESSQIGDATRIWAFTHILPGAVIGAECNICDHVFIENDVVVGNRVTVKSGVQLWDGIRIEDDVFIGPNVTFTNDPYPRSRQYPERFLKTVIEQGASIGGNATLLPGITVGEGAMVGAGSVVTHNVPAHAVVQGNPARIVRYIHQGDESSTIEMPVVPASDVLEERQGLGPLSLGVGECALWPLPAFEDMRGSLAVTQFSDDLPFQPNRCFFVYDVPSSKMRGEHAHKTCKQFLVAVHGELSIIVDDGERRKEIRLGSPRIGLYVPPGIWGIQCKFTTDAVLCVYASHAYQAGDYIRDYAEFKDFISED